MANFFTLQDGNLSSALIYGVSLSNAEVMNNTTGVWLSTVDAYSPSFIGDGGVLSAIAIHLSSANPNPLSSTLTLKLSTNVGGGSVLTTETYAISNFTVYDGSNNLLTPYPQNWQILKLSNSFTLTNLSSYKISLNTSNSSTLALVCSSYNNNYDKVIIKTNLSSPTSSDNIHIGGALKGLTLEPRTITAATSTFQNVYIHNKGTLNFPLTSTTLTINGSAGLQITSDGTLNIGTSSSVIPLSITHTIVLSSTQIDVHNGGNLNVYGYPKTVSTFLSSDSSSGSRTFTVTDLISTTWLAGDSVLFIPNTASKSSFDSLILSSFNSVNTFTTTVSNTYLHHSLSNLPYVPSIANLSRNIIIRGLNSTNRGTIRTIDAAKTSVNYAQLSNFGINSTNKNGFIIGNNLSGSTTLSGNVINTDNISNLNSIFPLSGRLFQNTINNNIILKSNISLSSLSANNSNIINNLILSSVGTGLQIINSTGSINISNNTSVGSLSYGSYFYNNILGTYGALNYNSGLQGMMISGTNTGTITGSSLYSGKEGVYVDSSTNNLSGLGFQNITTNSNTSVGFKVSGNNLNYLTPITLNINGLTANNNLDAGIEAYNITGNLSNIICNYNLNGIKTSIGNGPTIFDGISCMTQQSVSSLSITKTGTSLSAVSQLSSYPNEGSIKFTGTNSDKITTTSNTTLLDFSTNNFTIEAWVYKTDVGSANGNGIIASQDNGGVGLIDGWVITTNPNNQLHLQDITNGNIIKTLSSGNNSLELNKWTHIAICRSGTGLNQTYIFINGSLSATGTISAAIPISTSNNPITIGNYRYSGDLNRSFPGYISSVHVINGVALYTSNFTPPQTPFKLSNSYTNEFVFNGTGYNKNIIYLNNDKCYNINILSGYNYNKTIIKNSFLSSINYDNIYDNLISIRLDSTKFSEFGLDNSLIYASIPFELNATRNLIEGSYIINNSYLGSTPLGTGITSKYQPDATRNTGFSFTNLNKVLGYNIAYFVNGMKTLDSTIFFDSSASEKLTPYSSTKKFRSSSKYVALNAGDKTTVKVYVRKSTSAIDGSEYNGNPPRLMLKRNPSMGVFDDIVMYEFSNYSTVFETATISSPFVTNNGILEFYIDCDGTQGWINIDSWSAL